MGRAAVTVLESLGYHVIVPPQTCCGRPLYDFGLLDSAREHLEAAFSVLGQVLTMRTDSVLEAIVREPNVP